MSICSEVCYNSHVMTREHDNLHTVDRCKYRIGRIAIAAIFQKPYLQCGCAQEGVHMLNGPHCHHDINVAILSVMCGQAICSVLFNTHNYNECIQCYGFDRTFFLFCIDFITVWLIQNSIMNIQSFKTQFVQPVRDCQKKNAIKVHLTDRQF